MSDKVYVLTCIMKTGLARTTTLSGFLAESICDAEFQKLRKDNDVLFAILIEDDVDTPRAVYCPLVTG